MANFDFNAYLQREASKAGNQTQKTYKVNYFKLADDGDEAIVRFNYKTLDTLHFATVHTVKTNGGYKKISCLRKDYYEPRDNCPLCLSEDININKVKTRVYVELVHYIKQDDGTYIPQAEVWDRPAGFAKELASYYQKLGDLRNYVFIITRNGAAKSMDTKYTLMLSPEQIYKQELFVKDFTAFDDCDLTKFGYYIKTADEMHEFLKTGDFPQRQHTESVADSIKTGQSSNVQSYSEQKEYKVEVEDLAASSFNTEESTTKVAEPIRQATAQSDQTERPKRPSYNY